MLALLRDASTAPGLTPSSWNDQNSELLYIELASDSHRLGANSCLTQPDDAMISSHHLPLALAALLVLGVESHAVAQSNATSKLPAPKKQPVTVQLAELKERVASLEREIEALKNEIKALRRDKEATAPGASPTSTKQSAKKREGFRAVVTLADGVEVQVDNIRLKETPSGIWIGETPERFATDIYLRLEKNGVTVTRAIPFSQIENIEFTTFVEKDAVNPMVRKMLIRLKDRGAIEWVHASESVTITSADGETEKLKSFQWLRGVLSSGEKVQDQVYSISGFVGSGLVDGERGEWQSDPVAIKSIRFTAKN